NATVFDPTRLIWVADIVSFAEHFAAEIDWERLRAVYPLVLDVLSLFDSMTPLSEQLRATARLEIGTVPHGVGEEFSGWPRSSLAAQRAKGYARIVRESFVPSEWWLRMHYGLGTARPLFWYRWVRHPVEILGWAVHLLRERRVGFAPRLNGRYRTTLSSETQK
ncbi:MAG TPA: hypothetical protein VER55_11080, partial [Ardenticatenaceae bacterium]|nr:hypothetical protein [Ardenticatenaceae bacterium]